MGHLLVHIYMWLNLIMPIEPRQGPVHFAVTIPSCGAGFALRKLSQGTEPLGKQDFKWIELSKVQDLTDLTNKNVGLTKRKPTNRGGRTMLNSSHTCHGYHQQIIVEKTDEGRANLNDAATMELLQYTQKMVRIQRHWYLNLQISWFYDIGYATHRNSTTQDGDTTQA